MVIVSLLSRLAEREGSIGRACLWSSPTFKFDNSRPQSSSSETHTIEPCSLVNTGSDVLR